MSTKPDTETALLSAINAQPEEDTPRLVYADWCDENDQPERAEFIRLQIEIASWGDIGPEEALKASNMIRRIKKGAPVRMNAKTPATKLVREFLVFEKHRAKWLRVECQQCSGRGYYGSDRENCTHCDGTGDVGRLVPWATSPDEEANYPYLTIWRRGFPDEVRGCRLADVFEQVNATISHIQGDGSGWRLAEWAKRVFAAHPVTRVPLVDRMPYHNGYGHAWFDMRRDRASLSVPAEAELPGNVFDALLVVEGTQIVNTRFAAYTSTEGAIDALAKAVADVVRSTLNRPINS